MSNATGEVFLNGFSFALRHQADVDAAREQAQRAMARRQAVRAQRALLSALRNSNATVNGPVSISESIRRGSTISSNVSPDRSATALFLAAQYRLAEVLRTGPVAPTGDALDGLQKVLALFVRSGGPTPQVGLDNDGDLNVEWIVNEQVVRVDVSSDGDCVIYGRTPDGRYLFDFECARSDDAAPQDLQRVRDVLAEMGHAVRNPIEA